MWAGSRAHARNFEAAASSSSQFRSGAVRVARKTQGSGSGTSIPSSRTRGAARAVTVPARHGASTLRISSRFRSVWNSRAGTLIWGDRVWWTNSCAGAKVGAKPDALGRTSADVCGIGWGADLHCSTPPDVSEHVRSTYGSEGWGFESLRAHSEERPLVSGDAERGPSSCGGRWTVVNRWEAAAPPPGWGAARAVNPSAAPTAPNSRRPCFTDLGEKRWHRTERVPPSKSIWETPSVTGPAGA